MVNHSIILTMVEAEINTLVIDECTETDLGV